MCLQSNKVYFQKDVAPTQKGWYKGTEKETH